ncbi:B12 binding protein [Krasilnikovia cinnamomea]|uniref:B12 binding protein n=1 Tax=Krasilnikovia cinnamomea TaxID=349313 RepID=A0A4Q7ZKP0_9ACTN|nr:MerR family transcriptional regulator [Krasilnikovia cinnamomea]RZU50845.1 B12 binding protein [Krasilnikovia cinnamomea]
MVDEALTAGAAARRLGVAVTTLRTWHQRYGLGPSQHSPGRHRRYTVEDMQRLEVMRRLTARGMTPAEAAGWARRAVVPMDVAMPSSLGHAAPTDAAARQRRDGPTAAGQPSRGRDLADAGKLSRGGGPTDAGKPGRGGGPTDAREPRRGGGPTVASARAGPAARGVARAAARLDAASVRDLLETHVADHGVVAAWHEVIMPVLVGVGERYAATQRFIEVEHVVSRCVAEVLGAVPRPSPGAPTRILLAAADEEQHTLPLEALAAALAELGVPCRSLGARVPPQALDDAVARTGPTAVVLWSQQRQTADPGQLGRLLDGPHRPLLVAAAGPGWDRAELPDTVPVLGSLPEAVTAVMAVADPARPRIDLRWC